MTAFFQRHEDTLQGALKAIRERDYWSPYPEMPSGKIYGETAKADGEAAFKGRLDGAFVLDGHPDSGQPVGSEASPFGLQLGVSYPSAPVADLVAAAKAAQPDWGRADVETRVGVCLEILHRLNAASYEMANAVMHTTGQAFMMAFQAGGPHAQDRGLEAVAYAYEEMARTPRTATWVKPVGRDEAITLDKEFRIVPRGVALAIGCATFPTWNTYPGLFASLATGNGVVVKPHPTAILPLALTVETGRAVLKEAGFDPNLLILAADNPEAPITQDLVTHPDIGLIDFTGSNAFGQWVRENAAPGVPVFTEEAGVNTIVVAGTDNFKGMCANIAFSLSLYSGQMCTAPQNIYVPRGGIDTDQGPKTFDEVAQGIAIGVDKLLSDPARAAGVCGAVANPATVERVAAVAGKGEVVRSSGAIEGMDGARTATPLILKGDAGDGGAFDEECFGPISFVIAVDDAETGIDTASSLARRKGAITAAVYSLDEAVLDHAADAFSAAGVNLSCNLLGGIFVNQSAAFSDFHVTGANPAGNASLTDAAFVANRFRVATVRKLVS